MSPGWWKCFWTRIGKGHAHNHYIIEPIKPFHGNLKLTNYHLPLVWYDIVLLPPNDPPLDDEEREYDEDEEEDE